MIEENNQLKYARILTENYNTTLSDESVRNIIKNAFNGEILINDKNIEARKFINDFSLKHYPNEVAIKSIFLNQILLRSKKNVTIFEFRVGNSRLDLCQINGNNKSVAFEIKTDYDTPKRLEQQMHDYFQVFENVYLICSKKRLDKFINFIPKECGIYVYDIKASGNYSFIKLRSAKKSYKLSSKSQLSALTKKDLISYFECPYSHDKEEMIKYCLDLLSENEINKRFKLCLRNKYQMKWEYFLSIKNDILEIDYQWFYKNSISPKIVYS